MTAFLVCGNFISEKNSMHVKIVLISLSIGYKHIYKRHSRFFSIYCPGSRAFSFSIYAFVSISILLFFSLPPHPSPPYFAIFASSNINVAYGVGCGYETEGFKWERREVIHPNKKNIHKKRAGGGGREIRFKYQALLYCIVYYYLSLRYRYEDMNMVLVWCLN